MDREKTLKSNQEQAIGSWINYLNQVRINRLTELLAKQNTNLVEAINSIDLAMESIRDNIIIKNRGGKNGMHGFIAEIAEWGIGNARQQVKGKAGNYSWINDNGPTDLVRDGVAIQQKFVNSVNYLSLKAISEHLNKYPEYIKNGGMYQIPEDHYLKIKQILEMPADIANKRSTQDGEFSLKQWKFVHSFFEENTIPLDKIEASKLTYDSVQVNKIGETVEAEKQKLRQTNDRNNKHAYEESLPSFDEGIKVTVASGIIEGGTTFCMLVACKIKSGKRISNFSNEDWKDIIKGTQKSTLKGSIRGVTIYGLTNATSTPAAVASAISTASFGVADQIHLFRSGNLTEIELIENSEVICLEASISALSSFMGQVVIPIPVIGAVIGNTIGTIMYQIGKDKFKATEQAFLKAYQEAQRNLDANLKVKYEKIIAKLMDELEDYLILLEQAFSIDVASALDGSVELAKRVGIPHSEILDSKEKIQAYFME